MKAPIAAIDVGTNSVLLTIARRDELGGLSVIDQRATVTRLGQGVDQSGVLHPDAHRRTLDCLRDYRTVMDYYGVHSAAAVGTSALRDARGGADFLNEARRLLGFPLEVISGQREAELTFQGALLGLSVTGEACVFDIGGGSTEIIIGDAHSGAIISSVSLNIGSVRLTERLGLSDPPSRTQLVEVESEIARQLETFDLSRARGLPLIGVAGTVTTLAAISMEMDSYDADKIHGSTLSAEDLFALSDRIFFMNVSDRLDLVGLTKGRADVIGAGATLCSRIVREIGAQELIISDRGVRFGLLRSLETTD